MAAEYWIAGFHAWTVPQAWLALFLPRNGPVGSHHAAALVVTLLIAGILVALLARGRAGDWLIVLLVAVPVVCSSGISLILRPIVVDRYYLFAHVFALCAIAFLLDRPIPRSLRVLVAAVLLVNSLLVHACYQQELNIANRPGLRAAVEHVLSSRKRGEPVLVSHPAIFHAARYYAGNHAILRLLINESPSHYNGGPLLLPHDTLRAETLKEGMDRIWVLDSDGFKRTFRRAVLPSEWVPVRETFRAWREVYDFQGQVTAELFERDTTSIDDGDIHGPASPATISSTTR